MGCFFSSKCSLNSVCIALTPAARHRLYLPLCSFLPALAGSCAAAERRDALTALHDPSYAIEYSKDVDIHAMALAGFNGPVDIQGIVMGDASATASFYKNYVANIIWALEPQSRVSMGRGVAPPGAGQVDAVSSLLIFKNIRGLVCSPARPPRLG